MCGGKMVALATLCLILALGFTALECAIVILSSGTGTRDDNSPEKSSKIKEINLKECCPNMPDLVRATSVTGCIPPNSVPQTQNSTSDELRVKRCVTECAFMADGFIELGTRGWYKLNVTSLNTMLDSFAQGAWKNAVSNAQEHCLENRNYTARGYPCSSGAYETNRCISSVMATYCPTLFASDACFRRIAKLRRNLKQKRRSTTTIPPVL